MRVSTSALRDAMTLASTQTDEVTIRPDGEGWHIRAVCPSHVTMTDIRLTSGAFTDPEVWEPFAVRTADILDALSTAGPDTEVSLEKGRLVLRSNGLRYRKALLAATDATPAPSLELSTQAMLPRDRLLQVVSKGDPKHGAVRLTVSGGRFVAEIMDEQDMGVVLEVPEGECTLLLGEASGVYPVGPWTAFLRALPKGTLLDIQLDDDMPAVVRAGQEGLETVWMVAPQLWED